MIWVWIIPPLVPVTARAEVPAVAVEPAFTVSVLVPFPDVTLVGEKVAVIPGGTPVTANATAELNPFDGATVITTDAELPTLTPTPVGLGVSVKLGALTARVRATVRLNPPPVPVTTIGIVPAKTFAAALTVIVTGAALVSVGDENATVIPVGKPAADKVTGALKPPCALMDRVAVIV
jgi:hypothetical protein